MPPTGHQAALAAWRDNVGGKQEQPGSAILAGLTEAYPGRHITRTDASKCDVLGYAAAGFASKSACEDSEYEATRVYRAPKSGVTEAKGKLEDVVNFGKWDYSHDGAEFIVYEVTYQDRYLQVIKLQFILAPHSPGLHHADVDKLLHAAGIWTRQTHDEVWVYDDQQWSKSQALWQAVQGTTWDDVVLEPAMRAKLHRDIHGFFDNRSLYSRAKIPWKRGIIFHGVPGNGKSMTLAVTINELAKREPAIPALYVKSLDGCAGPKYSLQEIFAKARKTAPCLLVLEDLDSLVTDNTRSYFLNEVDGLASNDGILIIGSTNHLSRLDTSVTKRPSRFDRKYHFKLPEENERLAYCNYWRKKFSGDDLGSGGGEDGLGIELTEEMCEVIAKWTVGYSFAYLKELFVTALLLHTHGADDEDESVGEPQANGDAKAHDTAAKPDPRSKTTETKAVNGETGEDGETRNPDPSESTATEEAPRVLPDVRIPPPLEHNALLHIFRTQAQALLEEMDTSGGEKEGPKAPAASEPPIKFKMPSLLDKDGDD